MCVRRRIHLRSLSDVTPASLTHTPRARSQSERPRASPSPSRAALRSPAKAPALSPLFVSTPGAPRFVRSERSSPDASMAALDDTFASSDVGIARRFGGRDRSGSDAFSVLGNPWQKMSEVDLNTAAGRGRTGGRGALDPWVRNSTMRSDTSFERPATRDDANRTSSDSEQKREGSTVKRGKLERKSAVACESCGNDSCECWRTQWARQARAARSLGAHCTCDARSPRRSPARLRPRVASRALSDDEERPRRLYKSASQKTISIPIDGERVKKGDPLLETTC